MNPCNEPRMPDSAWRAWLARHPLWHAPAIAPCGGSAVRTWLKRAAISLGGVAGAVGVGAGVAPVVAAAVRDSARPVAFAAVAGAAPVSVPEPSSLGLMLIALTIWAGALLFTWCLCAIAARADRGEG